MFWPAAAVAIFTVTALLHASGRLSRIEHAVADARASVLQHERRSDIVIVGIDSKSLQALNEWPWPRRHHARLLQQLRRSAPQRVFLDIDFSSHASEQDDALLERALADWSDAPVYLAAHFQTRSGAESQLTITRPLPQLAQHAHQASVILEPSDDGLVREMRSTWDINGERLASIFASEPGVPANSAMPIDFSIAIPSFGFVSFIDVLNGSVDPAALRGKTVYVGPTALELGDVLTVPVYRALPGVVVQALATESARAGVLRAVPEWALIGLLAALAAACCATFDRRSWRRNAMVGGALLTALAAATLVLYAESRVIFDVVPFALVVLGAFVVATVRSLDQETWRALANAVGIRRRDALLRSVVESSADSILCVDDHGVIKTANAAASRLFATPRSTLVGSPLGHFLPNLLEPPTRTLDHFVDSVVEQNADTAAGARVPVETSVSRVATEERLYTVIVRDVSERHAQRQALEHQATHDPLTALPNRTALTTHLTETLGGAVQQQRVALLMLDLTRFKEVNDTLGHDVGDEVLREVARRFSTQLGGAGFISRIGGDEFTVVLRGVERRTTVDEVAQRLVESLRTPIDARGIAIEVGVNIGIAIAPDHARDAKELLRHADVAMYVAKRNGTAFEYYERGDDQHTVRRLSMLSELRSAIENGGIRLHYQPQVNLKTRRVESAEALVRWQHAIHGNIGPTEFVTLAESTDLIRPLTDWTIRQALADITAWSKRGLSIRVAINVSARVLQDVELPRRLDELLRASSVRPKQVELEITESAMLVDPERARRIVKDLHTLGFLISIDDYGTGFSSLGYLRDLRAHALKLDKSFVVDLESRSQNRVIVESTVQMAHALGLEVVAEGVESEWVESYLRSIGYDVGQGFWFARPMAADDCYQWIRKFNETGEQRAASA